MDLRPELQGDDPLTLYQRWLDEATRSEPNDPTAAALATATPDGIPSVRMVLLKGADLRGLSFFTNAESEKGEEIGANPHAALCLHWKSLRRQIRVAGPVSDLPPDEVDRYFHSRSRRSQIGAAVSQQSQPLPSRTVLEQQVERFSEAVGDKEVPRPDFWRGYLVQPERFEFWIDGPDRLHDRLLFLREGGNWKTTLLYP